MSRRSTARTLLEVTAAAGSVYAVRALLRNKEEQLANEHLAEGRTILILGSGFAGSAVAQELARLLPGKQNGKIILVDANNYLLFTPMLTEAAGGAVDPRHIIQPVRSMRDKIQFVQGRITSIDLEKRSVEVETGSEELDPVTSTFQADHLVFALGSVVSFHNTPGAEEHSISMKKLDDASAAFERVSACLERASLEDDAAKRRELLTFVVGGGGYTGVETMAAINDFVRDSTARLPRIRTGEIKTILVHPGDRLMAETSPQLSAYAQQKLEARGVKVRLNTKINSAGSDFVEVGDGDRIPTRTLIWAAGVTPNPLLENLSAPKGKHHGLKVNGACQVSGFSDVWALGDCAEIPQADGTGTYAPTAQNATREGKLVAQNIVRELRGEQTQPFRYKPMGELALVGRRVGVARVFGQNFSGVFAWAMWRAVYLAKMPSYAQQARILGDWVLDVLVGQTPVPVTTGKRKITGHMTR